MFKQLNQAKQFLKTTPFETKGQIQLDAIIRIKNEGKENALAFYRDCIETTINVPSLCAYALLGHYIVKNF